MAIIQKRVKTVLERMIKLVEEDRDYADFFSQDIDILLDELLGNDAFGTEGQNDPRGDGRDGDFSMWYVQGIDYEK